MNARAYKIVFVVLSVCVLGIIVLQAYWLRNFYEQEVARFNSAVYSALELASNKINDREALGLVKDRIYVNTQTESKELKDLKRKVPKFPNKASHKNTVKESARPSLPQLHTQTLVQSAVIVSEEGKQLFISQTKETDTTSNNHLRVQIFDQDHAEKELFINNLDSARAELSRRLDTSHYERRTKHKHDDVDVLVDKVMYEIKVMDTEINNRDTVNKLISDVLRNKGIFQKFEFAYYHSNSDTAKPFLQSDGFNKTQQSFKADLNIQNVIKRNRVLALQFPKRRDAALAAMSGSIWVSGIFSLIVLLAFFYSIFLIRRQKNVTELRNDFVNNMTHELKTPLATMSLALDAMAKEQVKQDSDRAEMYRRILKEENEKMNQHVERVLQLSVMDRREQHKKATVFSVRDVLHNAVKNFKLKAEEQQIALKMGELLESAPVLGQAEQFELALNNLLDNAIKYSGPKSEVTIAMRREQNNVLISICDQGPGIDKKHLEKIFEKFYRVQGGDVHDVKGFGLGLSFARQIIFDLNGTLQVKSKVGEGSTFIIQLPLHD